MIIDNLFCDHSKIKLSKSEKYTYINCVKCFGYLCQFRNDLPEHQNLDRLIARKMYIFGPRYELSDQQLKKWV